MRYVHRCGAGYCEYHRAGVRSDRRKLTWLLTLLFKAAYPYQEDILALPVTNLDAASKYYVNAFGMREIERKKVPHPCVILERDGVQIGFAINGGDAANDGAAILVSDIAAARDMLEANGVAWANWRIDESDGKKLQVFFVVAPDGLCYYFHQPID